MFTKAKVLTLALVSVFAVATATAGALMLANNDAPGGGGGVKAANLYSDKVYNYLPFASGTEVIYVPNLGKTKLGSMSMDNYGDFGMNLDSANGYLYIINYGNAAGWYNLVVSFFVQNHETFSGEYYCTILFNISEPPPDPPPPPPVTVDQAALTINSNSAVTFGSTLAITVGGGSGTGAYAVTRVNGTGTATISGSGTSWTLTPTAVGTVTVRVNKAGDSNYNAATQITKAITINKLGVAKPTLSTTSFAYDGTTKTPTKDPTTSAAFTYGGTQSASAIGDYTITATLGSNYQWSDGSTTAASLPWNIFQASVAKPTLSATSFTYDGTAKTPTKDPETSTYFSYDGTQSATAVGNYTITATLGVGYEWDDGSKTVISLDWSIVPASVAKPTLSGTTSFAYDGTTKTPTKDPATATGFTYGGTQSATVVSNYTITATLGSNYQWADGSTTAVSLNWNIVGSITADFAADSSGTATIYSGSTANLSAVKFDDNITLAFTPAAGKTIAALVLYDGSKIIYNSAVTTATAEPTDSWTLIPSHCQYRIWATGGVVYVKIQGLSQNITIAAATV